MDRSISEGERGQRIFEANKARSGEAPAVPLYELACGCYRRRLLGAIEERRCAAHQLDWRVKK